VCSSDLVVEFLKTDLRRAMKQGHSLKEIQALLAEQGVSVPLSRMEDILKQPSTRKKADKLKPESLFSMATQESHAEEKSSRDNQKNTTRSIG
jgi:hypothetical protein